MEGQPTQNGNKVSVTVLPTVPEERKSPQINFEWLLKINDNNTNLERATLCASEFIGTATLVFLGCMGCVVGLSGGHIPHEQISWSFGLAVMIAIQCVGHISGSHINPVVTVASVILGYTPVIHLPIYFVGQMTGAIAGYGALISVTPADQIGGRYFNTTEGLVKTLGVCSPSVNPQISAFQGLGVEFFISLLLVLVCCGVWDSRNADKHDSTPIRFGLAIAGLAMVGGPFTSANMNPARSFAPALWNGDWDNQWLFWVGPLAAAVIGSVVYRVLFTKESKEPPSGPEAVPLSMKA